MVFQAHQHLHFIGIGGAGLSAIARILLLRGVRVSGSDRTPNALTDALARDGATIYTGHRAENIDGADAVIVTSAAASDHVEIAAARTHGIPVYTRADIIADVMAGQTAICVAGTHGKTTTTAMIVHILRATGRDPSYIVGGVLRSTGTNAGVGQGAAFVIEADEYGLMFLGLRPQIAVINNIEWDHPDFFPTPAAMEDAFQQFAALVPPDGILIAGADSPTAARLAAARRQGRQLNITYALDQGADMRAVALEADTFNVVRSGRTIGAVRLRVPGRHNVQNALAALLVADTQGVPFTEAARALATFEGTGRRFDVRVDAAGIAVIDDYAHHPTAIRVTVDAARARYPERALWAIWQPHTYSRTRALWDDYLRAFDAADQVVVTDIYAAREQPDGETTSARFVEALARSRANIHHAPTLTDAAALLVAQVRAPATILIMSAGDAPEIGIEFLRRRL
ncbi:MAG: UDP-N-acetylmuramate--L-alanine ligase [Chloroflexota bacterium]|nr:UDP-N-acetylmuramate--L-alanine ligase [Chloroflexota bacterium]